MKISKIRNNIIEKYFACLFGAVVRQNNNYLDTSFCSENDSNIVKIDVFDQKHNNYAIKRTINFSLEERGIIHCISKEIRNLLQVKVPPIYLNTCMRQAQLVGIAKSISPSNCKTILSLVDILDELSQQTYEGQKLAFSLGIEEDIKSSKNKISDIYKYDFIRLLTSCQNSLLVCSRTGGIINHISTFEIENKQSHTSPMDHQHIASWTSDSRCALSLNKRGDILIFKNKNLVFARRSGQWRYFPPTIHSSIVKNIALFNTSTTDTDIYIAVLNSLYVSILDVSFQRSGACIGILSKDKIYSSHGIINDLDVISELDILDKEKSYKSIVMKSVIAGKKFHELSRPLRQEILSMDGATIIFDDGTILAVGAILKINSGSDGGGRRAAARALSKYGIGIKVSSDGQITIWHDPSHPEYFEEIG